MRHNQLFDSLIEALQFKQAEGGNGRMYMKEKGGFTYILIDDSGWEMGHGPYIQVFRIDSKKGFIIKLRNRLGEEHIDVHDEEVEEAAYEVLRRYEFVVFNEQ